MPEKRILIREAKLIDLEDIFYLYDSYMFDSYLLKFGRTFVKKYLKVIIRSKDCTTLVAGRDHLAGFIMATFNSKKILSELFFNIEILSAWIKGVFLRPVLAFECLGLISYPFNTYLKNVNAEFLFIAIEPTYRKRNIATRLIKEVLDLMRQRRIKRVKVTALVRNEAVNRLLAKLGFKVEKTFRLFNKYMYLYSYQLH